MGHTGITVYSPVNCAPFSHPCVTTPRQRDEPALRKYAPLAETAAQRIGHRLYQAVAHRAWAVAHRLAGEYAEAGGRLNQALNLFQDLGTHWQIGRTWLELGELAAAQNELAQARDCFQRALDDFEALRATPDADRARAALAEVRI